MSRASDRAYAQVREMILSGELPSGAHLVEEVLADRCGVSRTPVREALRRLEAELLVKRSATQRMYVADWSLDDVAEAFDLRAVLESMVARRAAERIDSQTLEQLRACNFAIKAAICAKKPDVGGFLDGNREFHAIILKTADSPRLAALLGTLIEQPVVWRTAHHYGREELMRSHHEHDELIAAFERADGGWAEAIMAAHVRRAFHAYADAHKGALLADALEEAAE